MQTVFYFGRIFCSSCRLFQSVKSVFFWQHFLLQQVTLSIDEICFFGRIFCCSFRLFQLIKSVFLAIFSAATIDSFNWWNLFFSRFFCCSYRCSNSTKSVFFGKIFCISYRLLKSMQSGFFCGQIFCYLQLCELTSTFNPKTRIVWGPTLVQSSWYSRIFFPTHELVILTKFHKDLQDIVHFWIVEKFGVSPFFSISF